MMGEKLAAYDAQNNVVAFYDTDDSPAPKEAKVIPITNAKWSELLVGQASGMRLKVDDSGEPTLLPPLPPTPEQVVTRNTVQRDSLLERASVALAPLQMAISLEDATDDEKKVASQWVTFSRAVKVVDLTIAEPVWPEEPT